MKNHKAARQTNVISPKTTPVTIKPKAGPEPVSAELIFDVLVVDIFDTVVDDAAAFDGISDTVTGSGVGTCVGTGVGTVVAAGAGLAGMVGVASWVTH